MFTFVGLLKCVKVFTLLSQCCALSNKSINDTCVCVGETYYLPVGANIFVSGQQRSAAIVFICLCALPLRLTGDLQLDL